MNYYNDNDDFCIQWQKYLADNQFIPPGQFDARSIQDVQPDDVAGFQQCHFFAGMGGWSRALDIAGWPEGCEVWTASCPCQPFSVAGKQRGIADDRHLWPELYRLINECRPTIIFGEQVAGPAGWGWFAAIRADLEDSNYAVGAAGLCAAGVGAPHIRQRIYWVAVRDSQRFNPRTWKGRSAGGLGECGGAGGVYNPHGAGLEGYAGDVPGSEKPGRNEAETQRPITPPAASPWGGCQFVPCADGKARPVKPGILPVADGVSDRVGLIKGYGNAIVPQVAAAFISGVMDYGC